MSYGNGNGNRQQWQKLQRLGLATERSLPLGALRSMLTRASAICPSEGAAALK